MTTTEKIVKTISQEEDCCGRLGAESQYLKIKYIDNMAGFYVVIKTDRWAVDDREENS